MKRNRNIILQAAIMAILSGSAWNSIPLYGQTPAQATSAYQNFMTARGNGSSEDLLYNALNECFNANYSLLLSGGGSSAELAEAKRVLTEIHPYLLTAAAHYSSKGNQNNALVFARAYVDIPQMDAFRGQHMNLGDQYPKVAYMAASGSFNRGEYGKAIPYFQAYLQTGDQSHRKDVYTFMAKACSNERNYPLAVKTLKEGLVQYPKDWNMISMGINSAIDGEDHGALQEFLDMAFEIKPQDETLQNIQGKLYEDTQQYQKALTHYVKMRQAKPQSLQLAKHVALNYYNLGALQYNKASMEGNSGGAKKLRRQANEYFTAAAATMEDIVSNDPAGVKYLEALAVCYSCIGDQGKLDSANARLNAVGRQMVDNGVLPSLMDNIDNANLNLAAHSVTGNSPAVTPSGPATTFNALSSGGEIPIYSEFAKQYVKQEMEAWQAKDPYETLAEYQKRVTEETRDKKLKELLKDAEKKYIDAFTKGIRFNDMELKPYDAENGVFLVESKYGELIVPVPRTNNEARVFENGWSGMQFKDPQFYINNDKLTLSSLTFVSPTGKTYRYDGDKNLNYVETIVDVSFDPIDQTMLASAGGSSKKNNISRQQVSVGSSIPKSDVDENIPETKKQNEKTFALIIANENYSAVAPVPMAINDGEVFAQYCEKTLGLPKENIRKYTDATYGTFLRSMRDISNIASTFNGDMELIVYYAGHGIPDESTKDAYLLPVDADGTQTEGAYSLKEFYNQLDALGTARTVVFLDACFSGSQRGEGMLASARGVAIKARPAEPTGQTIIFSAASDDQTAMPYTEKGHGLFTYYLLKKLQETKGNVTLEELGDYLTQQVSRQSNVINRKPQTPTVSASRAVSGDWRKDKLMK